MLWGGDSWVTPANLQRGAQSFRPFALKHRIIRSARLRRTGALTYAWLIAQKLPKKTFVEAWKVFEGH